MAKPYLRAGPGRNKEDSEQTANAKAYVLGKLTTGNEAEQVFLQKVLCASLLRATYVLYLGYNELQQQVICLHRDRTLECVWAE